MREPKHRRSPSGPRLAAALWLGLSFGGIGQALAQSECGPLANAYGPYDYWVNKAELPIVDSNHFTPEVETLQRGKSSSIGGDLDYTLRAFPNHARALVAMVNLGVKERTAKPSGSRYTVECWLIRAIQFRPNDATARVIYASFLSKAGRRPQAVKELEAAEAAGATSPNFHYNLGLAYLDVGDFEKSLDHAHKAYLGGFNLPGLKSRLLKAGKWRDPVPPVKSTTPEVPPAGDSGGATTEAKPEASR
ncbi:MAG: ABC transporter permease [Burkholderiales bacterium]